MVRQRIRNMSKCLDFNGTTDVISTTLTAHLPLYSAVTTAFTVALWVKFKSMATNKYFYAEGNTSTITPYYGLSLQAQGKLQIFARNDSNTVLANSLQTPTSVIFINKWHHICLVDNNGTVNLYVDAVESASGALNYTRSGTLTLNTNSTGALIRTTVSNNTNCLIDEIVAFNRALSSSEVTKLYSTGLYDSTNLAVYQKLDEGSGTSATDSSGNSNTGTITGALYRNSDLPFSGLRTLIT